MPFSARYFTARSTHKTFSYAFVVCSHEGMFTYIHRGRRRRPPRTEPNRGKEQVNTAEFSLPSQTPANECIESNPAAQRRAIIRRLRRINRNWGLPLTTYQPSYETLLVL